MPRLEIFELESPLPGEGLAGADTFARDLTWLQSRGVTVTRHGLDRDRAAFYANEHVRSLLEAQGTAALPLALADDAILSAGAYPVRLELARALGLGAADDDAYLAGVAAVGVALGLKLAAHEAAAIERVWQKLLRLGLAGKVFQDAVCATLAATGPTDPQITEALDRLCAHGSVRSPGAGCCSGRPAAGSGEGKRAGRPITREGMS